jgi:flagellin-like hook-associated protein FlgL
MLSAGTAYQATAGRIVDSYIVNGGRMAQSMTRMSSGLAIPKPHDNVSTYFRGDINRRETSDYERIRRDIFQAQQVVKVAEEAGMYVFDDLTRMQELTELYWSDVSTDEDRGMYKVEFDAIKAGAASMIEEARYDGKKLIRDSSADPIRTLQLNPHDFSQTMQITFDSSDVAAPGGLTIDGPDKATALAAVGAERDKAAGYLAKISAYDFGLSSHYDSFGKKVEANNEYYDAIFAVDDAEETMAMVKHSVRTQSSLAMLAQTNMFRQSVLGLLG